MTKYKKISKKYFLTLEMTKKKKIKLCLFVLNLLNILKYSFDGRQNG